MDITIALQRAVRGWAHGSAALAARLGISVTSLSHKVSPTYPTAHASPEEMVDIMEVTGDHSALHAMGARLGYVLLPVPQAGQADGSLQALAASVSEFGQFVSEVSTSLADNRVTDNERARIEAEGAQALHAIERLMALTARINQDAKPAPVVELQKSERARGRA